MNNAGIRSAILGLSCLRSLLRFAWHHAYLFQHAHEIVEKILFHDLVLFVPVRDGTEINVEALASGLNHGSIRQHQYARLRGPKQHRQSTSTVSRYRQNGRW
jgi:hypothetical protein